jgi:hypothetical protein
LRRQAAWAVPAREKRSFPFLFRCQSSLLCSV